VLPPAGHVMAIVKRKVESHYSCRCALLMIER
jgi:hypothetical protein